MSRSRRSRNGISGAVKLTGGILAASAVACLGIGAIEYSEDVAEVTTPRRCTITESLHNKPVDIATVGQWIFDVSGLIHSRPLSALTPEERLERKQLETIIDRNRGLSDSNTQVDRPQSPEAFVCIDVFGDYRLAGQGLLLLVGASSAREQQLPFDASELILCGEEAGTVGGSMPTLSCTNV